MASNEISPMTPPPDRAANTSDGKITLGPEYQLGVDLPQAIKALATFIDGEGNSAEAEAFRKRAENFDKAFREQYEREANKLTPDKRQAQVRWTREDEGPNGEHNLEKGMQAITELWKTTKRKGTPGQDRWHIVEDMKSEFLNLVDYARSGQSDGFHKITAIPAISHDIGRLAEERITTTTTGGEDGNLHPKLSGMMLNAILTHIPGIPADVHNQMVYAVLAHQGWNPNKDNLVGHFTNSEPTSQEVLKIERSGLVGPHAISRMIAYDVGAQAAKSLDFATKVNPERQTKLDAANNTDLFHHIEFYMRNLFSLDVDGAPQAVNQAVNDRADQLKAVSGAFLHLASTDEIRKQIFAPELARDRGEAIDEATLTQNRKKPLSPKVWNLIKTLAAEAQADSSYNQTLETLTLESLAEVMSGEADTPIGKKTHERVQAKIKAVTDPEARKRLAYGLEFACRAGKIQSEKEESIMRAALASKQLAPDHSVERVLTEFVTDFQGILNPRPQAA